MISPNALPGFGALLGPDDSGRAEVLKLLSGSGIVGIRGALGTRSRLVLME